MEFHLQYDHIENDKLWNGCSLGICISKKSRKDCIIYYFCHRFILTKGPNAKPSEESFTLRKRQEIHQPLQNYNFIYYYAYLLYPPLYISGPVTTYNAWISQVII